MKGEINLLPRENVTKRERRFCLAGVGRLIQRISMLLLLVIIGEALVYFSFSYISRTVAESNQTVLGDHSVVEETRKTNELLRDFEQREQSYVDWSLFIEDVLKVVPSGVQIKGLEVKENVGILKISGSSRDSTKVLEFQKLIKELYWADKVEAPLQNFAIGTNAGFSFDVKIKSEL